MKKKDSDEKRFRENGVPWDERAYEAVRHAALHLAECYMKRVLDEIPRVRGGEAGGGGRREGRREAREGSKGPSAK